MLFLNTVYLVILKIVLWAKYSIYLLEEIFLRVANYMPETLGENILESMLSFQQQVLLLLVNAEPRGWFVWTFPYYF